MVLALKAAATVLEVDDPAVRPPTLNRVVEDVQEFVADFFIGRRDATRSLKRPDIGRPGALHGTHPFFKGQPEAASFR